MGLFSRIRRRGCRLVALAIGIAIGATAVACGPVSSGASTAPTAPVAMMPDRVELTVVHLNDFEGRFEPITATRQQFVFGGIARVAGAVEKLRREAEQNREPILVLDAGDFCGTGDLHDLTAGAATLRLQNRLRPDAATIGANELMRGPTALAARLRGESAPSPLPAPNNDGGDDDASDGLGAKRPEAAVFPVLCANLSLPEAPWKPHVIKSLEGLKIGLIGVISPAVQSALPERFAAAVEITDPAVAVRRSLDALQGQVDTVIVVSYGPIDADREWSKPFAGQIALIVNGGSERATSRGDADASVPIVSADRHGRWLGRVTLEINRREKTAKLKGRPELIDLRAEPAFAPENTAMATALAEERQLVQALLDRPLATVADPLRHDVQPESPLAVWQAEAMLAAVPGADVAVMNWGGVRETWEAGPLTVATIRRSNPFGNRLVTVVLSGRDLQMGVALNMDSRPLQLANATVDYCRQRERGLRLLGLSIGEAPVDPEKNYTVVTIDYIADRLEGYFSRSDPTPVVDTTIRDVDALAAHAKKLGTISPPTHRVYRLREAPPPSSAGTDAGPVDFLVGTFALVRVFDGDTIAVRGFPKSMRLVGIDTEENFKNDHGRPAHEWREIAERDFAAYYAQQRGSHSKPVKCGTPMGEAATDYARRRLRDVRFVRLEFDDLSRQIDMYDRLLVHVFYQHPDDGPDGPWHNFNLEMVELGYSPYFNKYGNLVRFHDEFVAAQQRAQAAKKNIWAPPDSGVPAFYPDYPERLEWWNRRAAATAAYEAQRAADKSAAPWQASGGRDREKMLGAIGERVEMLVHPLDAHPELPAIECVFEGDAEKFYVRFADAAQMAEWWPREFTGEYIRVRGTLSHDADGKRWFLTPASAADIAIFE